VLSLLSDAFFFQLTDAATEADERRRLEGEALGQVARKSRVDNVLHLMESERYHHVKLVHFVLLFQLEKMHHADTCNPPSNLIILTISVIIMMPARYLLSA